jgi:ribosome-binding protein aMBF1 (putative translation factor)
MTELIPDAEIGQKVADARSFMGMSQNELAEHLTARGLPFYQTTVSRIEDGARPLRLNEAVVVAAALNVNVMNLLGTVETSTAEYWQEGRRSAFTAAINLLTKEMNR